MNKKAICILSGGMDSTLASYIAKNDGYDIIAVHFNYGQRTEKRELQAFRNICEDLKISEKYEIDIPFFTQIGASALTDDSIDIPVDGVEEGVPVTYVPFRNGIFLSITAAIAEKEKAEKEANSEERAAARAERNAERTKKRFENLDADGNGSVSAEEYKMAGEKMFDRMDRNDDGILNDRRGRGERRGRGRGGRS